MILNDFEIRIVLIFKINSKLGKKMKFLFKEIIKFSTFKILRKNFNYYNQQIE